MGEVRLDDILTKDKRTREDPSTTRTVKTTGKTGSQRLEDIQGSQTIEVPRDRDLIPTQSKDNPIGLTEQQKAFFKGQKEIGFWEGLGRSEGLNDLRRLVQHNDLNPFNLGTSIEELHEASKWDNVSFLNLIDVKQAVGNFQEDDYKDIINKFGKPVSAKAQRDEDIALINGFIFKFEEERIRGSTTLGKIGGGVGELPLFMIEFMATGPAAAAVKKTVGLSIKKGVKESFKKKILRSSAGLGVEAAVRTALLPHRTAAGFSERQIFANMELTEKGIQLRQESTENYPQLV